MSVSKHFGMDQLPYPDRLLRYWWKIGPNRFESHYAFAYGVIECGESDFDSFGPFWNGSTTVLG
jgi:hypothetical protein